MTDLAHTNGSARCVLCPAACELQVVPTGPDRWRSEFPLEDGHGLCPRGSSLGELLGHPHRILAPALREGSALRAVSMADALGGVLAQSADTGLTILLDGQVPIEQMLEVAACCEAWPKASVCFVVEPAERLLLTGADQSGAEYLADDDLTDCDGFVIVGDAFAADPPLARRVFDCRKAHPRIPIVTLDAAAGTPAKFATHRVDVAVGKLLEALAATANAAGLDADPADNPSAVLAGKALAACARLGVVVAAEYGRGEDWHRIGNLAGQLAAARGGGLVIPTVGLNALAAVRLNAALGGVALAEAISSDAVSIAIGCDMLGMLGWPGGYFAAAAALPNRTTEAARYVLPVTMPGEWAGTFLVGGSTLVRVDPLLPPPAGVPSPAELVVMLAGRAGVSPAKMAETSAALKRLTAKAGAPEPLHNHSPSPALLLARRAGHHGCGALTGHGSWQAAVTDVPELRIGAGYARKLNIPNLAIVNVRVGEKLMHARARYSPELVGDYVVLAEGLADARALTPSFIEQETGQVGAEPMAVDVSI